MNIGEFRKLASLFRKEPVYCFTSDVDWAPEWAIQKTLDVFSELEVPLTPFITHYSKAVEDRYRRHGKSRYVALHPNFLENSSHGRTYKDQIDFVTRLWPEAVCFRAHAFFDNSIITKEFYSRGFRYDSNLCLFLQPYCTPLQHESGLIRFPVFWEDDVHWRKYKFSLRTIQKHIDAPGLKIFNFHPFSLVLNIPSAGYYQKHKFLYQIETEEIERLEKYVCRGKGDRTFLEELVSHLQKRRVRFYYLHDLWQELCN